MTTQPQGLLDWRILPAQQAEHSPHTSPHFFHTWLVISPLSVSSTSSLARRLDSRSSASAWLTSSRSETAPCSSVTSASCVLSAAMAAASAAVRCCRAETSLRASASCCCASCAAVSACSARGWRRAAHVEGSGQGREGGEAKGECRPRLAAAGGKRAAVCRMWGRGGT